MDSEFNFLPLLITLINHFFLHFNAIQVLNTDCAKCRKKNIITHITKFTKFAGNLLEYTRIGVLFTVG